MVCVFSIFLKLEEIQRIDSESLKYSPGVWRVLKLTLGCNDNFSHFAVVKNLTASIGDASSIPGSGRFPGERNGNPLHYSCLGNPMDRGGWWLRSMGLQRVNSRVHFSSFTGLIYSLKLLTSIFFIKSCSLDDFTSFFPMSFTKFNSFN